MLEKKSATRMTFFRWFKIGFLCSIVSGAVVISGILMLNQFMPDRVAQVKFSHLSEKAGKEFKQKAVKIEGRLTVSGSKLALAAAKGEGSITAVCAENVKLADVVKFAGKIVDVNGTIDSKKDEAGKMVHTLTINTIAEAVEDKK